MVLIKIALRLSLSLSLVIGTIGFIAIMVGKTSQTSIVVAVVKTQQTNYHQIALIDINRNLRTRIPFPRGWEFLEAWRAYYLHPDGHQILLPGLGDNEDKKFVVWNFLTGELIHSPDDYSCRANSLGWWATDRLKITCERDDATTDIYPYIFNTTTSEIYLVESYSYLSPHQDKLMRVSNRDLYITSLQDNQTIQHTLSFEPFRNPYDEISMNIDLAKWFPDSQSILVAWSNFLMRYTLADQSLQVLFDGYELIDYGYPSGISPMVSPDGEWVVWCDNRHWSFIYTLNVTTGEYHDMTFGDTSMYVARMYWSANGKYILINYAPRTVEDAGFHDTVYYIAKPDGSFSVLLTEDGNLRPVISPNEQFIAYPNTKDELFIIDLNQFSKEGITPFASINHDSRIMWDSNSEGIVFVYHSNLRPNQLAYYHANTGIRFLTNNHEIPTSEMAFLNR